MKTLLLSEIFPPQTGGSGRWFQEIYSRLERDQVVIAAGGHARQKEFDKSHHLNVVRDLQPMSTWGVASPAGFTGYARGICRIRRLITRERPAMIHAGRCLPEGVIALALRFLTGIPYLCYVHGEDVSTARSSRELSFLVRRVLSSAACCIANSRNTVSLLRRDWGLTSERINILYPGVDTQKFVPAVQDHRLRKRLNWQDRTVVLTVGRLQKRKGHDMLIRALPLIREIFPDILYSIVGDGEEFSTLENLSSQVGMQNHVQILREIDDEELVTCYQQCDLFVLPNRIHDRDIEGFGMVLLEAQACGRPVIAGDSGGTAETMISRHTGLIVDCTSPKPLAEAVLELLSDASRRQTMGDLGRQWVVRNFDWNSLATEASELFGIRRIAGKEIRHEDVPVRV